MKRFWDKVDKSAGDNACWPWIACKLPSGYGRFRIGGRDGFITTAHRIAYKLAKGDPGGLFVLHRCDNPSCCNPNHLLLGSHKDNMADMRAKKRSLVGRRNTQARYTEGIIMAIRAEHRRTGKFGKALAPKFNISPSYINAILRVEIWKHVP